MRERFSYASATNTAIASPCPSTTYRTAASTPSRFNNHRVLPCRAHRFRSGPSAPVSFNRRLAYDLKSFITRLWFGFRLDNNMNVVRPNVRCKERPLAMRANLSYGIQYRRAAERAQYVGGLVHQIPFVRCPIRVGFQRAMSRDVVVPIHGTGFVAVQMRTIAGERNQVRHARSFYTAPLRSRLTGSTVTRLDHRYASRGSVQGAVSR